MKKNIVIPTKWYRNYSIREIVSSDIKNGRFLSALENLSVKVVPASRAEQIFWEIKSNPFHKVFVAVRENIVIGSTSLLVEPKFIYSGGLVGHIEDVVVSKEYTGMGIGSNLIRFTINVARKLYRCKKLILDCSDKNMSFYEKLGFSYQDNCMTIIWNN
jgi:glucosamine-phosphate N-acetyltransferase